MSYRDDEEARAARLRALEQQAAEAEELRRRLWAAEEENRRLRSLLAERDDAPVRSSPALPPFEIVELPHHDFGDPRLAAAEAAEDWMLLADLYEEHASGGDLERMVVALLRLGDLLEDHLADPHRADEAYARALDLDPASVPALSRRIAIARDAERWVDLVELLGQRIDLATHDRERAALELARADVYRDQLGDEHAAVDAVRRALDIDPSLAVSVGRHRP